MSGVKVFNTPEIFLGDVVSFEVYPSAILGNGFNRVKLLSVLSPADAAKEADVIVKHTQVLAYLTAEDKALYATYRDYNYLKIQLPNNSTTVIGIPWIKQTTLAKVTATQGRYDITVDNPSQFDEILSILKARGFTKVTFSLLG